MNTDTSLSKSKSEPPRKPQIKKDIEEYVRFFGDNVKRYKRSMRFAFKETLDDRARRVLKALDKPELEVNYVQPYLSSLLGERAQQSPDVTVSGNGTGSEVNVKTVDIVEGHLRNILDVYHKAGQSKQVSKEQCGGAFSVLKVFTEYRSDESFVQDIVLGKSDDPVMCFFDPMSKLPSKSDGNICGEFIPMTKKEAKGKYPEYSDTIDAMSFNVKASDGGAAISWSYKNGTKDIVILADTFVVEKEKQTIVLLADDRVMLESDYNKMIKEWDNKFEPPPAVANRRVTDKQKIKRYVMLDEYVLEEEDTSLPGLPYIFVDGDSAFVYKTDTGGEVEQVVRSYIHNAIDAQKLLNSTCQTIANYSENYMQQKFIVDERGIVDAEQWDNPQRAATLVGRSIDDKGREVPPPKEIIQSDLPASVMSTWHGMQNVMQNTFGADTQLGSNGGTLLSGRAVRDAATQNNAVKMPFKDGLMDALNAASGLILKMIPLYYVTPMTIPYTDKEGEKNFVEINGRLPDGSNDPDSIRIDYGENDLDVKVAAGYSFALQKDKSLETMEGLSKAFPAFAEVINKKGLSIIAENLDIHSKDKLIQLIKEEQEQSENQPNQPNPVEQQIMLKQQELQIKKQQNEMEMQAKMAELKLEERKIESNERIAAMKFQQDLINDAVQHEKVEAEINTHQADNAAKLADHLLRKNAQEHTHTLDIAKMHE